VITPDDRLRGARHTSAAFGEFLGDLVQIPSDFRGDIPYRRHVVPFAVASAGVDRLRLATSVIAREKSKGVVTVGLPQLPGKTFGAMKRLVSLYNVATAKHIITDGLLLAIFWEETLFNNVFQTDGTAVGFGQVEPSYFWAIDRYKIGLPPVRWASTIKMVERWDVAASARVRVPSSSQFEKLDRLTSLTVPSVPTTASSNTAPSIRARIASGVHSTRISRWQSTHPTSSNSRNAAQRSVFASCSTN